MDLERVAFFVMAVATLLSASFGWRLAGGRTAAYHPRRSVALVIKAGKPILSRKTILKILPGPLLLMTTSLFLQDYFAANRLFL